MDDIGDFGGLPRLVFIDEECGKHRVVDDDRDLTRKINQKNGMFYNSMRKFTLWQMLQATIFVQ